MHGFSKNGNTQTLYLAQMRSGGEAIGACADDSDVAEHFSTIALPERSFRDEDSERRQQHV
jgi:hypothetical protein